MSKDELEKNMKKYGIKSKYELSKALGVDESTISRGLKNGFSKMGKAALKYYFLYLKENTKHTMS